VGPLDPHSLRIHATSCLHPTPCGDSTHSPPPRTCSQNSCYQCPPSLPCGFHSPIISSFLRAILRTWWLLYSLYHPVFSSPPYLMTPLYTLVVICSPQTKILNLCTCPHFIMEMTGKSCHHLWKRIYLSMLCIFRPSLSQFIIPFLV
jgi:hypothetical protein